MRINYRILHSELSEIPHRVHSLHCLDWYG